MADGKPLTILCVSSYEKGQEFIRTCKALGCTVLLLTVEKLRHADWPFDGISEVFTMPEELPLQSIIYSVSYLARHHQIDRIVALDEFDMENVSALREHLRIPGMGLTTVRYFRDKLAMRARAKEAGIAVPEFVHILNHHEVSEFMQRVPAPWLLKPRSQASGIGMRKIHRESELWPLLDQLGDQQSFYLLEQFVPGSVFHVDSVASEKNVLLAEVHAYGTPPLDTSHQGGVFTTRTLARDCADSKTLLDINKQVLEGLGFLRGVTHAEFLKSHADGKFYFIEVAARVGGAYISDIVEAASGINLWREWARLEVGAGKTSYQLPTIRKDYAGIILSLARQETPDTSAYSDPEIIYRVNKYHHAGLLVKSASGERVQNLLDAYAPRFANDFLATQPVPERPSS
jgi:biotin carboxylase